MTDPQSPHARFDEARQLFLVAWQDFCHSVPDATRQAEALATQRAMRQIAALVPEPDGDGEQC